MSAKNEVLKLPPRGEKLPNKGHTRVRSSGLTHVIDKGLGPNQVEDLIATAVEYVDVVKLGWGTGYVSQNLREKVARYRGAGLAVCFGGTLLEVAILQKRVDAFCAMCEELEMSFVEISNGVLELTMKEKAKYIEALRKRGFVVLSEVGSKDAERIIPPFHWVELIRNDLDAGAWKVICEARESGTVGLYFGSGEARAGLIDEIVRGVGGGVEKIVFEAPQRSQQIYMVRKFGSNVNLGNIAADDVIGLETLRLGLRGDTLPNFHPVDAWNKQREAALERELPMSRQERQLKGVVSKPTVPAWRRAPKRG